MGDGLKSNNFKTHKDLAVWKNAMEFAEKTYFLTGKFPKEEQFGLTSQLRRSVVSIPSNIAEGSARSSKKEFLQFLYISLGSLAEAETQLLLAKRLRFFNDDSLLNELEIIRKMLLGLIKYLRGKANA